MNILAMGALARRRAAFRGAKQSIADAEEACRKAQGFAQSAAQAFGEVSQKLNNAWKQLEK